VRLAEIANGKAAVTNVACGGPDNYEQGICRPAKRKAAPCGRAQEGLRPLAELTCKNEFTIGSYALNAARQIANGAVEASAVIFSPNEQQKPPSG
jgi:hypothetical protein